MNPNNYSTPITLILASVFALSVLFVQPVYAGSLWDMQSDLKNNVGPVYGNAGQPTDLRISVVNVIGVFLGFLAVLMLVMIIWAGFRWMTAGGNEEQVKEARKRIINAVIGLFIILFSYGLTIFVTEVLFKAVNNR